MHEPGPARSVVVAVHQGRKHPLQAPPGGDEHGAQLQVGRTIFLESPGAPSGQITEPKPGRRWITGELMVSRRRAILLLHFIAKEKSHRQTKVQARADCGIIDLLTRSHCTRRLMSRLRSSWSTSVMENVGEVAWNPDSALARSWSGRAFQFNSYQVYQLPMCSLASHYAKMALSSQLSILALTEGNS